MHAPRYHHTPISSAVEPPPSHRQYPTPPPFARGVPARHTSTSSSSSTAPLSYVNTLRRQRATVWTSQSQIEDPRILAARAAEKQRAASELGRRAGKTEGGAALMVPGVVTLPERMSASELDDLEGWDREMGDVMRGYGGETGSSAHNASDGIEESESEKDMELRVGSSSGTKNFAEHSTSGGYTADEVDKSKSTDNERPTLEPKGRRGSLDEDEARTMTMSGIRLFVANPD